MNRSHSNKVYRHFEPVVAVAAPGKSTLRRLLDDKKVNNHNLRIK